MKHIKWLPTTPDVSISIPEPKPAKNFFPEWYKKLPKFENNKFDVFSDSVGVKANLTAKSCMPFFDSFMNGYIQETWCDIFIKKEENSIHFFYSNMPEIMSVRKNVSLKEMNNDFFYSAEFEWKQYWIPKMPKGYSMLYTHPLNRTDLPFFSFSGIIDNDKYYKEKIAGNHPFFIKKDFNGIIPKGTPMYQMIPIKRERWFSKKINHDKNWENTEIGPRSFFYDGYKKLFWQKKEFR